jgi:hypothetical protein
MVAESTGSAGADALFAWAAGIGALLGVLAAAGMVMRWLGSLVRDVRLIRDDLVGQPARPGVPERPGIMVRVKSAEDQLRELCARVGGMERLMGQALLGQPGGEREAPPVVESALLVRPA